jgi:hypothetical protein
MAAIAEGAVNTDNCRRSAQGQTIDPISISLLCRRAQIVRVETHARTAFFLAALTIEGG